MKKLILFLPILLFVLTLLHLNQVSQNTYNTIQNLIISFIPTLYPTLLLINLLGTNGSLDYFFKLVKNPYLIRIVLIALLFFVGVPSSTELISNLNKKGLLSNDESQLLMENFSYPSFAFIYGVLGKNLVSTKFLLIIIFVPLIVGLTNYLIKYRKLNKTIEYIKEQNINTPIFTAVQDAIIKTTKSLVLVMGTMILFSLPLSFITIDNNYYYLFTGLLEFSYSTFFLSFSNSLADFWIIASILSFTSLSMFMQIKCLYPKLKLKSYLKKRSLITLASWCALLIFF